jgi:ubiquitin carboxyl-terminal hydrolase 14
LLADVWLKFDDKNVTTCTFEDDILKLAGGGDWHTAYLCLYQERKEE